MPIVITTNWRMSVSVIRPHPADDAVQDDNAPGQEDRGRRREPEDDVEDHPDGDGRGYGDHQVVGDDDRPDKERRAPVALPEHFGYGVQAEAAQTLREQEAEREDAEAEHEDEPHP